MPEYQANAPAPAWVDRVAHWVSESPLDGSRDIALDLAAVARRLAAGNSPNVSSTWLLRLADWIAADSRPQAPDIARQLREWAANRDNDRIVSEKH